MDIINEATRKVLSENYADKILTSTKSMYKPLNEENTRLMNVLLKNTQNAVRRMISEGTYTNDVAQFTPILLPMVRRIYPNLIAHELLGIQPMTMPTGYLFALVNEYLGTGLHKTASDTKPRGVVYQLVDANGDPVDVLKDGVINVAGYATNAQNPANGLNGASVGASSGDEQVTTTAGTSIGGGYVVYSEEDKILVTWDGVTAKLAAGDAVPGTNYTVRNVWSNEACFNQILKYYTGDYHYETKTVTDAQGNTVTQQVLVKGGLATPLAERLGVDMKEIGFTIQRKQVEAKSRNLKGRYTIEMFQDLQAQHDMDAETEMMNVMAQEINAEIDRECVEFVRSVSQWLPDTTFGGFHTTTPNIANGGVATPTFMVDGRWEIERYRAQAIRIAKEATQIGIECKRGQGNVILVSPMVATMLEQTAKFNLAPAGDINQPVAGGFAGIYDNRYRVIIDQYATDDYVTVMYKGADKRDALGFFAPYVPLTFTKTTNYESGQPSVVARTRYALATIPGIENADSDDRAKQYARSFAVDMTNSILRH